MDGCVLHLFVCVRLIKILSATLETDRLMFFKPGVNRLQRCFLYCSANAVHFTICFKCSFTGPSGFLFTQHHSGSEGIKSWLHKAGLAEHHCVLQWHVKKSSSVKRNLFLCFLRKESNQSFLLTPRICFLLDIPQGAG